MNAKVKDFVQKFISANKNTGDHKVSCPCGHKNPTLGINTDNGKYNCFVCGAHGPEKSEKSDYDKLTFIWNKSIIINAHPYLTKKQVKAYGTLKQDRYNNLVIPCWDINGELKTIQMIGEEQKLFLKGYKKQGSFFEITGKETDGKAFNFCEGYATGASIYEALEEKETVICCFDAGNLNPVIKQFRKKYPNGSFTICADSDRFNEGKTYHIGLIKADIAAKKYGCAIRIPFFAPEHDVKGNTDFNDLHVAQGLEAVKQQVLSDCNQEYIDGILKEIKEKKQQEKDYPPLEGVSNLPYNDTERSDFFLNEHGENLKYSYTQEKWYVWNNKQWFIDDKGKAKSLGVNIGREISSMFKTFAEETEDKKAKKDLMKYANITQNNTTINNLINISKSANNIPVDINDFDKDKWLFNCDNGTINLKTGDLQKHNRDDLNSKISPVKYDKNATCPLWIKFLNEIFDNNQDLLDFMQRSIGYSLTGEITEEVFWVFYGNGGNGKGTFISTIMKFFGAKDYGKQADFQTLFAPKNQQDDNVLNQIACLKGARFVTASEGKENAVLNESKVKELVSPDAGTVTGRFKFKDFFEYSPEYKIFLASNYKPTIKGTDEGIWRRVMLVPFLQNFKGKAKDKKLKEKLQAELPGILIWAVNGCLEWQKNGLNPPDIVINATQEYKKEQDWVNEFIAECCIIAPGAKVTAKLLYDKYIDWSGTKSSPKGKRDFNERLRAKGYKTKKGAGNRIFWQGIEIKPDDFFDSDFFDCNICENCESNPISDESYCIQFKQSVNNAQKKCNGVAFEPLKN